MSRISGSIIAVVVLVGVGLGTQSSAAAPLPEELPGNTVAVVSEVPASLGRITRIELQRRLVEQAAAAGFDSVPRSDGRQYAKLEKSAFGELLDAVWIRGQASSMRISISPRRVAAMRARLIRQAFRSNAEYWKFLRKAHLTRRDVNERVEEQLISTAIQRRIMRGVVGEREMQETLIEFVEAYETGWRARTVCAPELATERCSNGPPAARRPVR